MNSTVRLCLVSGMFLGASTAVHAEEFEQQENVVYAERHGVGLIMDIFTPTGPKNGVAIIDVISGGWNASRGKIEDHKRSQMFKIMCGRGYTVFAIRPGSLSRFSIEDMVSHLETGIVWVKVHAGDYGVDPNRLGLMGASAGGHLASLLAVRNGNSDAKPGNDKATVKAVAVFFPPTDFLEYADNGDSQASERVSMMALRGAAWHLTEEETREKLTRISPARVATKDAPPFLLIHGTADTVVPQSQSEKLRKALEDQGVPAKLILKEGGGHPWLTIHEEVAVIADWFDSHLAGKQK